MKNIKEVFLLFTIMLGTVSVSSYNASEVSEVKSEMHSEQTLQRDKALDANIEITGADNVLLKVGTDFDVEKGVKVNGTDWSSVDSNKKNIISNVDQYTAGTYQVTYVFEEVDVVTRTVYVIDNATIEEKNIVENVDEFLSVFGLSADTAEIVQTSTPLNELRIGVYDVTLKLHNASEEVTVSLTITENKTDKNIVTELCTKLNDGTSYIETFSESVRTERKYYSQKNCTGEITKLYKYHANGELSKKYVYYQTGIYSLTRNDYNEEGKVTNSARFYRSSGKANYRREYHENSKVKKVNNYNVNGRETSTEELNDDGIRIDYKKYDGKGFKTLDYNYYTDGKMQARYSYYKTGNYSYTRNDYSEAGKITNSTRYYRNGGKANYRKEYYENGKEKVIRHYNTNGQYTLVQSLTSNGIRSDYKKYDGKGNITINYDYYSDGKVKKRTKYFTNGKQSEIVDYYSNGKIKKIYKAHMEKNNVVTGVTEKWFNSSGKLQKIDARTYPTYYSQYNSNYQKYSCPAYNGNMYKHGCASWIFYSK